MIKSKEPSLCPLCGGGLIYRDMRRRYLKNSQGEKKRFMLRRLKCEECKKLHTEIPYFIQPYKHYSSETIQSVIDNNAGAGECAADNSTIRRWKNGFSEAGPDISQRLASVYARMSNEPATINQSASILKIIMNKNGRWLAFVMSLLINAGYKLRAQFAFCPSPLSARIQTVS